MKSHVSAFVSFGLLKPLLCFLLLFLVAGNSPVLGQGKEEHPCAAARVKTGALALADGITSKEHRALMRQYDLHWYKLDLALERNSINISGNVTMLASVVNNSLTEFAFELHPNFVIQQVLADGSPCFISRSGSEVIARLPTTKAKGTRCTIQVFYAGTAPTGASAAIGNGFSSAAAPPLGQPVTWSLSEPFAASEWFPCKQLLEDKADSVDVWVTTDITNKVGSNGILQRITPMPNQKHRYEWKSNYPIAYYLISVAVGQYEEYSFLVNLPGLAQPVLVQNYLYPQSLSTFKTEIDRTGSFLQVFSELFGLYPFHKEKYGHSMAPINGGMEHQTMTTQSTFEFTLTAHELGHQWWGDEVTCADWSHIWLNEGFASYSEYLAIERLLPAQKQNWLTRANQSALSYPQGSVFVKDSTNVNRIFNSGLSYRKGALVLHMLRHTLQNDAIFFQVLQAYRAAYRYQVTNTRNFQKVVEQVTGRSFQYFFDQWVYGEGHPVFDVAWAQKDNQVYIRSNQTGSSATTPLFTTEVEYRITTSLKDTLVVVQHTNQVENYQFKVSGVVQSITVDPNLWLLETVSRLQNDPSIVPTTTQQYPAVYPNPTTGTVTLSMRSGLPQKIAIYDMVGKHIRTFVPTGTSFSIADLRAGSYLLKIWTFEGVSQIRILKL